MGEGDGTPAERVATGSGWVNGVLVGNTNAVESRIFGPYHTPGGLERVGDGLISKNEVCCSQLAVSFINVHLRL